MASEKLNDKAYREAYNQGEELLPDYVYDATFGSEETDLDDNSGTGELIDHLHPMLSLPTYFVDIDNLTMAKLHELGYTGTNSTVSWKVDGVAVSMIVDGTTKQLLRMVSRGKRYAGFILNKAWHSVFPKLNCTELANTTYDFRGELYISKSDYERINSTLAKPYASPRAMVAGNMNALEPNLDIVNSCKILLHGIWIDDKPAMHVLELSKYFANDSIVPFNEINDNSIDTIKATYNEAMVNDIPCDGIVLQIDETIANNGRANLDRIAIKQLDENKYSGITTVDHIEWRLKNNGSYFPRIWYKPIQINGSTVTHTAGYCWDYIKQLGLSIGAEVQITMRGGVIPYVTKVYNRGNNDYQLPADIEPINDNDIHIWSNKSATAIERLKFIRGMEMLNLDQCGTELFSSMYDGGFNNLFTVAQAINDNTFTATMLSKLIVANTEAGMYKVNQIIDRFRTFNHVWLLLALREDGIGFKAANAIGQFLSGYTLKDTRLLNGKFVRQVLANQELIDNIIKYSNKVLPEHADLSIVETKVKEQGNKLKVCMSKKPSNGMKKSDFANTYLSSYDITDNIKEANILICPIGESSNKINYAIANNIEIKHYEDFC